MGAPAVINLPASVAPGGTVDISANMTAPSSLGHYRGNWKLRNASGGLFGVGSSGTSIFWVDIFVSSSSSYGGVYDFVANYASASWSSGGSVQKLDAPQLENGSVGNPGLLVTPQNVAGGYIQGVYPAFTVQAGDRFQSIVNCAYNAPSCYVNFRLNYQIGSGPVQSLWSFNERYEGLYYRVNLDLSSLAGQNVNFILYMADVSGYGNPAGDQAMWVETKIARSGVGPGPIPGPITSICDRGAFVADVTIPDGSVLAPGQAFTKTWEIRNVGTCTWTTAYSLVFAFGTPMGTSPAVNLPAAVASGVTADFSVNMVAPSTPGHYRSYWRFRNAAGNQFGVGSGMITFFADIYVAGSPLPPALLPSTTLITSDLPDPSSLGGSVPVSVTVSGTGATPTGVVTVTGADTNCTITLSGGSGSCNVVFNTAGAKTLTALYNGDSTYASSSDTESHTVNPTPGAASTTSIVGHTPSPSTPGQAVAVSVSVSGAGAAPTGTVAITGADNNCTITLSGGSGSCNVVFSTTGHKVLTALYSGNATYASSSDTEGHDVVTTTAFTTTKITADTPDPSIPGQVVDVEIEVTGAGTYPTGTVEITGADTNCTATLNDDGHGTCNVTFDTVGAKTLTAVYSGNNVYSGSSDIEGHTVSTGKAATATTITSHVPDPSTPGQPVVVNVTVSGAGLPAPSGTVEITGADTNCTILLLPDGTGSCTVIFNTTGHKTITATYSGDGQYAPSSGSVGHTVIKGSTTTTIILDRPDPSIPTQAVEVNFTVIGAGVTPTGIVSVSGADINCSITLSGGTGSCNVVFNTIGDKIITATYSGDANYLGSSDTEDHVVKNITTTTITSDILDPSSPGDMVTVSVTVSGAGAAPTGTVDITGADVNCSIALAGGSGSCAVQFLTAGAKLLTATYGGDANYVGSTGTASHTVSKGVSFTTITVDAPDPSVTFQAVTVTVTVTGAGVTPSGTVAITISSGQPSTCTITLVAGTGTCTTLVFNATGTFTITAAYSGDMNYYESSDTDDHIVG